MNALLKQHIVTQIFQKPTANLSGITCGNQYLNLVPNIALFDYKPGKSLRDNQFYQTEVKNIKHFMWMWNGNVFGAAMLAWDQHFISHIMFRCKYQNYIIMCNNEKQKEPEQWFDFQPRVLTLDLTLL